MRQTEFCECVSHYRYQFYIVAYAILENESDAEDAVCNAILSGYEHLEQLRNPGKFKSWMLTITKNEALKIRQKRLELLDDKKVEQLLPPSYDSHNELWDIVQRLPDEFRMVIVLFYYNNLPIRDISNVLEIPVGTVKSRLKRGRELLRKSLDE